MWQYQHSSQTGSFQRWPHVIAQYLHIIWIGWPHLFSNHLVLFPHPPLPQQINTTQFKHSFHKIALHHSVKLTPSSFSFMLPTHKADWFFESSMILIESWTGQLCPMQPFINYLMALSFLHACPPLAQVYRWGYNLLLVCSETQFMPWVGHSRPFNALWKSHDTCSFRHTR